MSSNYGSYGNWPTINLITTSLDDYIEYSSHVCYWNDVPQYSGSLYGIANENGHIISEYCTICGASRPLGG